MTYMIDEWDSALQAQVTRPATAGETAAIDAQKLAPKTVPQAVAMWQARAILIKEGLLTPINAYFASIPNQVAREQAIAKFEYSSTVQRNDPLVTQLIPALGKSEAQIDQMFIDAAAL